MTTYRTAQGDRLDLIAWKHYGSLEGRIVEQLLEANPGTALSEELSSGVLLQLPDIEPAPLEASLW